MKRSIAIFSLLLVVVSCPTTLCQDNDAARKLELDKQRSKRLIDELLSLVQRRTVMRDQAKAIAKWDPSLQLRMQSAYINAVTLEASNRATPFSQAVPTFMRWRDQRVATCNNRASSNPENAIWFMVQDNTQFKLAMASASMQRYLEANLDAQTLASNRAALIQLSYELEKNFELMREKIDWIGRRSALEHQESLSLARLEKARDPYNPGLALIEAVAHRSNGDFGEALQCMDDIDNLNERMQVLHFVLRLQIEWLLGNKESSESLSRELFVIGKEYGMVEPLLVRGWIALAEGNTELSNDCGSRIRNIAPDYVEGVVLKAWSMLLQPRPASRDASTMLLGIAPRTNAEDWYFHEVLAYAYAQREQWTKAEKEIGIAVDAAPSHLVDYLRSQQTAISSRNLPKIDMREHLKETWRIQSP